ncbi:TPA: hypothetical protein ACXRZU_000648 [Klebsiella pneumoniae]
MSEQKPSSIPDIPLSGKQKPSLKVKAAVYGAVAILILLVVAAVAFSKKVTSLQDEVISKFDQRVTTLEEQNKNADFSASLTALRTDVNSLQTGLSDTRKSVQDIQKQLDASSVNVRDQAALRDALSRLQEVQSTQESKLNALTDKLSSLSQRPAVPVVNPASAAKKLLPAKHRAVSRPVRIARKAPFVLTGVEQRGSEAWAAIAPHGYSSLSQVTLIGEGETVSGWTLVSAGGSRATFRVNGQITLLNVE